MSDPDLPLLSQARLFHNTALEDLLPLLGQCWRMEVARGVRLLEPGNNNDRLYMVLSGELRVYPGGEEILDHASLLPGDCAGEMSLIDGSGVSALVIAAQDCQLMVIPHDVLWELVERSHGVARNLLSILAGRVRSNNLALVQHNIRSLEFEQASSVDALTNLHNRRWMNEAFPRMIERCLRDGSPLCLLLADVDELGRINQGCGYLAGDAVLRSVAATLQEGLRPQDLLARLGGEKFVVLLPQTSTEQGLAVAERLRVAVAAAPLPEESAAAGGITLSCGIAPLSVAEELDSLLEAANRAVRRAKHNGRNRVELAVTGEI